MWKIDQDAARTALEQIAAQVLVPAKDARLDFVRRADELDVPILLLHSDDDGYVPSSGSRELAAARPDIVTFVPFETARHTKLWNYDRGRWNGVVADWLARRSVTAAR